MNEMEIWSQRRHEMAREVEVGRLAGRAETYPPILAHALRPYVRNPGTTPTPRAADGLKFRLGER